MSLPVPPESDESAPPPSKPFSPEEPRATGWGTGCTATAAFLGCWVLGTVVGPVVGHIVHANTAHAGGGGAHGPEGLEFIEYWFFGFVGGCFGGLLVGAFAAIAIGFRGSR